VNKVAERKPFEDWPNRRTYQYYGVAEMDEWRRRWEPVICGWRDNLSFLRGILETYDINSVSELVEALEKVDRLEAVKNLIPELKEILDMEWIWLSKKPLVRLLKWEEKLRAAVEGVAEEAGKEEG